MKTVSIRYLLNCDFWRLKNNLKSGGLREYLKYSIFGALTALFIAMEYFVALYLFNHIMAQVHLHELRFILLAKLLYMVFLVFAALLVYSNIIMAISSFFMNPEIDLIFARPVKHRTLFLYRFLETFLRSSWMFIAFGTPILFAYARVMERSFDFIAQLGLVIMPFLIFPTALGIMVAILLIRIFSPQRTQRVFVVMAIFLSVGLVVIFRWMKPEQLVDPIGVEQLTFYLKTLRMPSISWLPPAWAAEAYTLFGEGKTLQNLIYSGYLWAFTLVCFQGSWLVFRTFWWKARSRGRGTEADLNYRKTVSQTITPPSRFRMTLLHRDLNLFRRDASQWSQLIIIAALVFIYVFNFKNLPYELYGFQYSMAFVSVSAGSLILAALQARFAYPAVSSEGRAIWILKTSPLRWDRYLWYKYISFLIPTLVIGSILVLFSLIVLDAPSKLIVKCMLTMAFICIGMTGLSVGFGARFPRFDLNDAAMVAVSSGGLFYMIFSLAFIHIIIFLVVLPDIIIYMSYLGRYYRYIAFMDRYVIWTVIAVLTGGVVNFSMTEGIKELKS